MISIVLGNSYSQVNGLTREEHKKLSQALSYQTGNGYSSFHRRSLLTSKGAFPSGLLHRVKKCLGKGNYRLIDPRTRPSGLQRHFKPSLRHTPYLEQKAAVEAIKQSGGIVRLPTGCGKSLVAALIADALQLKTLIVTPNLGLKRQMAECIKEVFGDTPYVVVENIDSGRLKTLTGFDVLILDEAHHSAARTYRRLNRTAWKGIYYKIGLTATPFRADPEEQLLMESIVGPVAYSLSYADAVKKGYIMPVEAYYIDLPKIFVEGYTWQEVYKELVVDRKDRNKVIADTLLKLCNAGKSILTLVKEVKHGNILSEMTCCGFAHGESEYCESFIDGFNHTKLTGLIATTGVMGEGIDSKPAEYIIIAGLGKSRNAFMQQIGRAVRRYPGKESAKVIIFRDRSHKWTLAHFNAQKRTLKEEYGVEVVKLDNCL